MPLTMVQLEDLVFRLQDELEEVRERVEDLEDPHKRRQMNGAMPVRAQSSAQLQEKLYTRETRRWSQIGTDPDSQQYVQTTLSPGHAARRRAMGDVASILFPFSTPIKKAFSAFGPEGSSVRLKFRGSLVRGIKAFHKGNTKYQSGAFNNADFDCDAFIELPDTLWESFLGAGFKRQVHDSAGNLIQGRTAKITKDRRYESLPNIVLQADNQVVTEPKRLKWTDTLRRLGEIQRHIRGHLLAFIPGYRTIGGDYDFEFYLRPVSNVWWTYKEGNPYYQHQDLNGFGGRSAALVNEFLYKEKLDIQRYAEEFGAEGRIAPDFQCVLDDPNYWYVETQAVFSWLRAQHDYAMTNPAHSANWKTTMNRTIAELLADGKIVGQRYNQRTVQDIRRSPGYAAIAQNITATTSLYQY